MFKTISLILLALSSAAAAAAPAPDPAGIEFFENKVRPVLVERCYKCHSATSEKLKGGLLVDSLEGLLKGGDNGPAIIPGEPDKSRLMTAVAWSDPDLQMPPKQKLADQQIADLGEWVKRGAPWPQSGSPAPKPAGPAVFDLEARKASHWAWQPIRPQHPPEVLDSHWAAGSIDRFILAKLEAKGLHPAAPADRSALIRRASFDLTGLPPTLPEIQSFLDDPAPDAFAKVVDRLLASPHFGERWARHWMDLVRFGETRGHEFDPPIPNAWQYRDYLIRAFNADVPYDQFVREHLAGDLLNQPRLNPATGANESVLGTGFWFLGEEIHSPVDIRQDEADRMDNRVDTMAKAFLGLTVGCARCHDHKFDAIRQKDYYALTGFVLSAGYRQAPFESMDSFRRVAGQLDRLRAEARSRMPAAIIAGERPTLDRFAEYLLAARDLLVSENESAKAAPAGSPVTADRQSLDPAVLKGLARELRQARSDRGNPLHAFALVATDPSAADGPGFAAAMKPLRDGLTARTAAAAGPVPTQVILDYSTRGVGTADGSSAPDASGTTDRPTTGRNWYSDGVGFGLGPVRAGDLLLGGGLGANGRGAATRDPPAPGSAVLGVAEYAAAERDPILRPQRSAGTEPDFGALSGWQRAGQTIRTPTVTLKSGSLWYLVRGAGRAYGVVDSHLLIDGPLHGRLVMEWKGEFGKTEKGKPAPDTAAWKWVRHDLTPYAGQRCHVEFSPAGDGPMAIAKVIESDSPPRLDLDNAIVLAAVSDPAVTSASALARAYQKAFAAAAERWTAGAIAGSPDARDQARLADWLVRHADFLTPPGEARDSVTKIGKEFLAAQSDLVKAIKPESHAAPAMLEGNGVDENVLVRGVAKNAGEAVPRRFLEAIDGPDGKSYASGGSGRLTLAAAVLADNDPFAARVMVNRVWHHLFGRGIVATVDNFGVLGQRPTHPELLDYLADNFRHDQAWSIKRLIRSVMLSNTYQMSAAPSAEAEAADPQNLLLHHMPVKRLEGEAIRDAILAVSGRLNPQVGGPPVEVHLTEFMEGRGRPGGTGGPLDGDGRRSLYTKVRRNFLSPMMQAFDAPAPFACVGRRNVSNVPAQALILMNDPFVLAQAHVWARRVLADPDQTPEQRVAGMYLCALARPPTPEEVAAAAAFLDQQADAYGLPPDRRLRDERVWADLAHVMFNLKEFIFLR